MDLIVDPVTGAPKSLLVLFDAGSMGDPYKYTFEAYETKPVGAIFKQTSQPPCPLFPGLSGSPASSASSSTLGRRTLSSAAAGPTAAVHQSIPDWEEADAYFNSVTTGYIASNFTSLNLPHLIPYTPGPISADSDADSYDLSTDSFVSYIVKNQAQCGGW